MVAVAFWQKIIQFIQTTTNIIEINGLRKSTEIHITDNMGRVAGKFISNKYIDIGYLTVGVYSISILLDKTIITKRIIKE